MDSFRWGYDIDVVDPKYPDAGSDAGSDDETCVERICDTDSI